MTPKTRNPDDLEPHPYNVRLYRQEDPSERFIRDVAEKLEDPLIVNEENQIIDGVRRWLAVTKLGWDTVEVVEKSYESLQAEREAILRYNDDRDETYSQKMRVALEYEKEIAPSLKKRIEAGKELEELEDDPLLELAEGNTTSRDLAADRVNWSGSKYYQAKQIWKAAHGEDDVAEEVRELAQELVREIEDNDEDTSVYSAYQELNRAKKRQELEDPVTWDTIEAARIEEQFDRVDKTFGQVQTSLDASEDWSTLLDDLTDEYQTFWGESPSKGATHTFVYRLEKSGLADLSQDNFAAVSSLTDRKPDQDTLFDLYWEEDMNLTELAIRYGVREEVVEYWLREEDIDRKKREFTEEEQERIEQN